MDTTEEEVTNQDIAKQNIAEHDLTCHFIFHIGDFVVTAMAGKGIWVMFLAKGNKITEFYYAVSLQAYRQMGHIVGNMLVTPLISCS